VSEACSGPFRRSEELQTQEARALQQFPNRRWRFNVTILGKGYVRLFACCTHRSKARSNQVLLRVWKNRPGCAIARVPPRQMVFGALRFHLSPDVEPFLLLQNKGSSLSPEGAEDWSQKEGSPDRSDVGVRNRLVDAHYLRLFDDRRRRY